MGTKTETQGVQSLPDCEEAFAKARNFAFESPAQTEAKAGSHRHGQAPRFGTMFGSSPAMTGIFQMIEKVGPTEASVLIIGESGTGKELVADAIHKQSHRAKGNLVAINC